MVKIMIESMCKYAKWIYIIISSFVFIKESKAQIVDSIVLIKTNSNEFRSIEEKLFKQPDTVHIGANSDTLYFIQDDEKFIVISKYCNSVKIKSEAFFENGKLYKESTFNKIGLNGTYNVFYKNGKLKKTEFYIDGLRQYPILTWDESGRIESIEYFDFNLRKLVIKTWDQCSRINSIVTSLDSLISPSRGGAYSEVLYYENGIKKSEITFNKGIQLYLTYYENGQKATEGYIKDWPGQFVGEWTEWHSNGNMKSKGNYSFEQPNKKVGKWKTFSIDGGLIEERDENDLKVKNKLKR